MKKIVQNKRNLLIVLSLIFVAFIISAATLDLTGNIKVISSRWQDWMGQGAVSLQDGYWNDYQGGLYTDVDNAYAFFNIPYMPGTKLLKLRICAGNSVSSNTNITVYILKQEVGNAGDPYTTVDSNVFYGEPGGGLFGDTPWTFSSAITLESGYAYCIKVVADIYSGDEVMLFTIGLESEHIIY